MAEPLVEVKFDKAKLKRVQRMLRDIPQELPKVISRGINRTLGPARTEIVRRIREEINITQKSARSRIKIRKASRLLWVGTIDISNKRISLISFSPSKTKKGISYRIKKAGAREKLRGAFIQTMPSGGHEMVLRRLFYDEPQKERKIRRVSPTTGKPYLSGAPIVFLRGPSLGRVFENLPQVALAVTQQAYRNLEKNILSQVEYLLSKRRAGRGVA